MILIAGGILATLCLITVVRALLPAVAVVVLVAWVGATINLPPRHRSRRILVVHCREYYVSQVQHPTGTPTAARCVG